MKSIQQALDRSGTRSGSYQKGSVLLVCMHARTGCSLRSVSVPRPDRTSATQDSPQFHGRDSKASHFGLHVRDMSRGYCCCRGNEKNTVSMLTEK
jgi:hypothetical protein